MSRYFATIKDKFARYLRWYRFWVGYVCRSACWVFKGGIKKQWICECLFSVTNRIFPFQATPRAQIRSAHRRSGIGQSLFNYIGLSIFEKGNCKGRNIFI
jgi:hypothetical protein